MVINDQAYFVAGESHDMCGVQVIHHMIEGNIVIHDCKLCVLL